MYFSCHEIKNKEKTQTIDHRQQSSHYLSTRATPCGKRHDCASSEIVNDHIWPQRSVTCVSLIA
jgi:hypothetical protein